MKNSCEWVCYSRFLGLISIGLFLVSCGPAPSAGARSWALDEDLSASFRNLPYNAKAFSEIRIYETLASNFLSSEEISRLVPIKTLGTQGEIAAFLETMARGRVSNQDPATHNRTYSPICYHLIAVNVAGTAYGYLKVQISSDPSGPILAKVSRPDGTNSYENMKLLPELLEDMSAQNRK